LGSNGQVATDPQGGRRGQGSSDHRHPRDLRAARLVSRTIVEFVEHYHHERTHQGLDNVLIAAEGAQDGVGGIVRRERLGGLLSFYCREAA
jgi:hypothetical protein